MNRRDEFVVSCSYCGEVVGLKHGGERVPDAIHICPDDGAMNAEIAEQEEERIKWGGKSRDD